jgi:hypothetical protein
MRWVNPEKAPKRRYRTRSVALIASIGNLNTRRRWRGWSETADDSAAQQAFLIDTEIGEASTWIVAQDL